MAVERFEDLIAWQKSAESLAASDHPWPANVPQSDERKVFNSLLSTQSSALFPKLSRPNLVVSLDRNPSGSR
jgi:hypothetical protein